MFTGLIRDVGTICSWQKRADSVVFSVRTQLPLNELALGASVACNGACLTVIESKKSESTEHNLFSVEAGPQTLALTRFGANAFSGIGEQVNLEPALRFGDPLGGHVVSGHVDTLGRVLVNEPTSDGFWRLRVGFAAQFRNYVVKKGSISIAGVSLTIADCCQDEQLEPWVEIMLIPHTLDKTNLKLLRQGAEVELEFDSQAKLVADMLKFMLPQHLKILTHKN